MNSIYSYTILFGHRIQFTIMCASKPTARAFFALWVLNLVTFAAILYSTCIYIYFSTVKINEFICFVDFPIKFIIALQKGVLPSTEYTFIVFFYSMMD